MAPRTSRPTAQKRPKAVVPLDNAQRALRRILTADGDYGPDPRPTDELPAVPQEGTGVERPVPEWVELNQSLYRAFAFIDLSGFTHYTEQNGAHAATEVLTRFRTACRDVTARRGARVAKWLGDGVMIVGTEPGPVVAAAAELLLRFRDDPFEIHAGVAGGVVLLFEGDDYIGRPVNLAARLCEAASPGELLAVGVEEEVPEWVECRGKVTVRASGIGDIVEVLQLHVDDDAWAQPAASPFHPAVIGGTAVEPADAARASLGVPSTAADCGHG